MSVTSYELKDREILIAVDENVPVNTILYTVEARREGVEELAGQFCKDGVAFVCILTKDWFGDLTPWPAKTPFPSGPDFDGNGDALLDYLVNEAVPFAEEKLGVPTHRGVFGYSLGGLFAVYSFYKTNLFTLCGCPSGSMWYDNFLDWMRERRPGCDSGCVFFSIGDKEPLTTMKRMSVTDSCMKQACELLNSQGYKTTFGYTKGDHGDHVLERITNAVQWMLDNRQ